MTASWHTLLDVAIRTSVIYLALLVGLRVTGKRQLGQMSTFDFVLLLIIANAVQNAMVGPDTSLAGGLVAAGVPIGWRPRVGRGGGGGPGGAPRPPGGGSQALPPRSDAQRDSDQGRGAAAP